MDKVQEGHQEKVLTSEQATVGVRLLRQYPKKAGKGEGF